MLGSYRQGREEMLAQVRGSLEHTPGLQVAVSGDLRHSLPSLAALPPALGLDGALGQSDTLTEGNIPADRADCPLTKTGNIFESA